MAVQDTHPSFTEYADMVTICEDLYDGELIVKGKTDEYLLPTSGQLEDGFGKGAAKIGQLAYDAYLARAVVPDGVEQSALSSVGALNRKQAVITLPKEMEYLRESCTSDKESLDDLLRKIHLNQLLGRIGLLADVRIDKEGKPKAIISSYTSMAIRNWAVDDSFDDPEPLIFVLDESGYVMNHDLVWEFKKSYRALCLQHLIALRNEDGIETTSAEIELTNYNPRLVYSTGVFEDGESLNTEKLVVPQVKGQPFNSIPFTVINATDLALDPSKPPLLGLALLCLTAYRGEADYRQALFNQGHDTLVTIGAGIDSDDVVRVGAGARIDITNPEGDAKMIGSDSSGLSEQRSALENDYARIATRSGELSTETKKTGESGNALKTRIAANTVTLPQIAMTAAQGLENCLKQIAVWFDLNPDEVSVEPNVDFVPDELDGATLLQVTQARQSGLPLSKRSLHQWASNQGLTTLSFEEELEQLAVEGEDE